MSYYTTVMMNDSEDRQQQQQQHQQQHQLNPPARQNPSEQPIRHAGRAHIRGKIRRVWRPRYMEVLDSGLVRYYELPPTADIALPEDSDWAHVNMIPKDTLFILNARIIDVTTLRDLHVGLPRGSFGFLFRGQRQQVVSSPEMLAACGPPEPVMPRDFFCAVSTLVEAQTWVIALQWAATMCQARPSLSRASSGSFHGSSPAFITPGRHVTSSPVTYTSPFAASPTSAQLSTAQSPPTVTFSQQRSLVTPAGKVVQQMAGDTSIATNDSNSMGDVSFISKTELEGNEANVKTKTIVVTKVHKARVVRIRSLQFEVAYDIHLLLLQLRNDTLISVSERRAMRTLQDLEAIMDRLGTEVDRKSPLKLPFVTKLQKRMLTVPTIAANTTTAALPTSLCIPEDFQRACSTVDGILRAVSMDPVIVNSQTIRKCFGLLDYQSTSSTKRSGKASSKTKAKAPTQPKEMPSTWWTLHDPQYVAYTQTAQPAPSISTDLFVKNWLAKDTKNNRTLLPKWQLLLAQLYLWTIIVCGGVVLACVGPLWNVYQRYVAWNVSMRIDILILSWITAFGLGLYSTSSRASAQINSHGRQRTSRRSVPNVSGTRRSALSKQSAATGRGSRNNGAKRLTGLPNTTISVEESSDDVGPVGPAAASLASDGVVLGPSAVIDEGDDTETVDGEIHDDDSDGIEDADTINNDRLSSPLPVYPENGGASCWSLPEDKIFRVRGHNYLEDKIKIPSGQSPLKCRGVDVWLTDNPPRHIARHPSVLGGKLGDEDTFLVNFLLPFGNLVSYFTIPPLEEFPGKLRDVWQKFLKGDQQYRDARLKLLPVVVDGPWIVRAAVGNGTAPALLGQVIPLQYFFNEPDGNRKGVYEVDVIITASRIAKGILSVVKGHTKSLSIAFAFIIEAAEQHELPETVLACFQVHALHLEDCPHLPDSDMDGVTEQ